MGGIEGHPGIHAIQFWTGARGGEGMDSLGRKCDANTGRHPHLPWGDIGGPSGRHTYLEGTVEGGTGHAVRGKITEALAGDGNSQGTPEI